MRFLSSAGPFVASALSLLSVQVAARSQEPSAIQHVSILEHPVINTPSHEIDHLTEFDVTFELRDKHQKVKLELEPNHDILADDAYVQYLDAEGNIHREEPIQRHEHKVFKGRSLLRRDNGLWRPVGWARIYVQQDGSEPLFEGVFSVDNDNHHVELKSTYLQKKRVEDASIPNRKGEHMVVYRDSDMIRQVRNELKRSLVSSSSCQADKLGFNSDPQHPIFRSEIQGMDVGTSSYGSMSLNSLFGLSKRQSDIGSVSGNAGGVNLAQTIGINAGCPKTKQVALVGIAADCSFTASFDNDDAAKQWIINVVNSASDVYEKSFNISIGLRNLTLTDKSCPETAPASTQWNMPCDQSNITQRLNLFSQWRGQQSDGNAYWTLMSNCPTGSEVGLAWLGQLCNAEVTSDGSSAVSGTNVVVRVPGGGWQVFAHETGHTFGAVHDCDSQTCAANWEATSQCCPYSTGTCDANGKYIMNPSTEPDLTAFSPCTIGNICSALGRNSVKSNCLSDNRNVVTYTGSQCGNGIVEAGEECDCGGESSCGDNACCDATTCKFKNGAVCDDANDNCCSQCQFSAAGTVCRPSRGVCDLQETCTGNSSTCPSDSFKKDGEKCGSASGLTCASGECTSRDYQCRTLMGSVLHDNNTYACPQFDSSCELVCTSPSVGACFSINQNYLDGTPCGSGGYCRNGQCNGSNIGSWIEEHKNIVIGVACGVGGLIAIWIFWCLISRCCRRPRTVAKRPPPMRPWPGPMPPPPAQMGQWAGPNRGYQGLRAEPPPPPYPGPYQPAPRYA